MIAWSVASEWLPALRDAGSSLTGSRTAFGYCTFRCHIRMRTSNERTATPYFGKAETKERCYRFLGEVMRILRATSLLVNKRAHEPRAYAPVGN